MKKNDNIYFLLFSISLIALASLVITIAIIIKAEPEGTNDKPESEQWSWHFSKYDLSEEDREQFEQLQNEGVHMLEIIRIIVPEEYEELKEHPFSFNMLEKYGDQERLE